MLKPLMDVTAILQKRGYSVTHAQDDGTGHELLQAALSPGDIPFMTFSYDREHKCLIVNTELQFPDTYAIVDIALECMRVHNTVMGKAFLVVPTEDGKYDVLYDNQAYDYIANKMSQAEDEMQVMDDEENPYFISKHKKPNKGSVH